MAFTIDEANDQKQCTGCGSIMPLSAGHVCGHILAKEHQERRGLVPTPAPEAQKVSK